MVRVQTLLCVVALLCATTVGCRGEGKLSKQAPDAEENADTPAADSRRRSSDRTSRSSSGSSSTGSSSGRRSQSGGTDEAPPPRRRSGTSARASASSGSNSGSSSASVSTKRFEKYFAVASELRKKTRATAQVPAPITMTLYSPYIAPI